MQKAIDEARLAKYSPIFSLTKRKFKYPKIIRRVLRAKMILNLPS